MWVVCISVSRSVSVCHAENRITSPRKIRREFKLFDSLSHRMQKNTTLIQKHIPCRTHLMVLIGRDRNEGSLGEDVGAEGRVFGAKAVIFIRLYNVDPRLVLVHRV